MHDYCAINQEEGVFCDVCFADASSKPNTPSFTLPDSIRRSYIDEYESCPYSFYLSEMNGLHVDNEDREEGEMSNSIYAQIGIDLHDIYDKASWEKLSKEDMLELFHQAWYNYNPDFFPDEEFKEKMYQRAMMNLDNFHTIIQTLPKPLETEKKITYSVNEGLPSVNITMDRLDEDGDSLILTDWKTGKVMVGKKFTTDLQAPLYIHAVQTHYQKPVSKFNFIYTGENKIRTFYRINEDEFAVDVLKNTYTISITEALRRVNTLFSKMKNGDFNIPRDTKSMYFTCKMCVHREAGRCRGAETESWYTK